MPTGIRWTSFEAESLPIAALRIDSRLPSAISQVGFQGWVSREVEDGLTRPLNSIFGPETVYASGSHTGSEYFLMRDASSFKAYPGKEPLWSDYFNKLKSLGKKGKIFRNSRALLSDLNIEAPHLYKIRTNTHNIIPFRDFHIKFGESFSRFVLDRTETSQWVPNNYGLLQEYREYWKPFDKDISSLKKRYAAHLDDRHIVKIHTQISKGGQIKQDEYQISGPVFNRGKDFIPTITYISAEYLDLAI